VYDIAKELGIETAEALAKLNELGEYVKSGSSTIAPPVANKLRAAYPNAKPKEEAPKVEKAPAKPKATKAAATETVEEQIALLYRLADNCHSEDDAEMRSMNLMKIIDVCEP
jgi:translation initiation factor IF-2